MAVDTSEGSISFGTLLLASGKHEVRGIARDTAGSDTGFVGFKTYLRLPPAALAALGGAIEVTLFDGGYAGLQCVEGGMANLCLLVRRDRLATLGGWAELRGELARESGLARVLGDGEEILARPLAISGVPYGFVHRADGGTAYRLGDQAAVIPSFCGDGMAIALHSARLAADAVIAGAPADAYHARLRAGVGRQIGRAMRLQRLGGHPALRTLAVAALNLSPALLTRLAAATRVPEAALTAA